MSLSQKDMEVIGSLHQLRTLYFGASVFDVKDLLFLTGLTNLTNASIPLVVGREERGFECFAALTAIQVL